MSSYAAKTSATNDRELHNTGRDKTAAGFTDTRPKSIAQRKLQEAIDDTTQVKQLHDHGGAAQAVVQRVVAAGLAAGTHVVLNAGNLAGTVCTVHHEDPNYFGHHVYFVNIPGFGVPVALLLAELNPHNMAAAAA